MDDNSVGLIKTGLKKSSAWKVITNKCGKSLKYTEAIEEIKLIPRLKKNTNIYAIGKNTSGTPNVPPIKKIIKVNETNIRILSIATNST